MRVTDVPHASLDAPDIGRQESTSTAVLEKPSEPYEVLLWNDPVNVFDYVAYVLQKIFGYDEAKAERLMLIAHNEGRAAVWSGEQQRCIAYAQALHGYGLQATVAGGGDR